MFSRFRDRLGKIEARVTPQRERRVFVCVDEDVEAFKAANAVAPQDILVHIIPAPAADPQSIPDL